MALQELNAHTAVATSMLNNGDNPEHVHALRHATSAADGTAPVEPAPRHDDEHDVTVAEAAIGLLESELVRDDGRRAEKGRSAVASYPAARVPGAKRRTKGALAAIRIWPRAGGRPGGRPGAHRAGPTPAVPDTFETAGRGAQKEAR
ncbi:hypothetical protein ACIP79_31690 [Streptomyces sp. NPDC088747]|uniref:hypothetical protein n=1 Tax=Streptomyces sp. NPDC088747 TaxID=3365886 RepID=UPI0038035FDD